MSTRSYLDAPGDPIPDAPRLWERASSPWLAVRIARSVLTAPGILALQGCIAIIVVASSMGPSPKVEFEGRADGRLYANYVDACYWKSRYDPAHSLCGRLIESREIREGIEYVHGPYGQCVYSFVVDQSTQLITSWRYVSAPEACWIPATAE